MSDERDQNRDQGRDRDQGHEARPEERSSKIMLFVILAIIVAGIAAFLMLRPNPSGQGTSAPGSQHTSLDKAEGEGGIQCPRCARLAGWSID